SRPLPSQRQCPLESPVFFAKRWRGSQDAGSVLEASLPPASSRLEQARALRVRSFARVRIGDRRKAVNHGVGLAWRIRSRKSRQLRLTGSNKMSVVPVGLSVFVGFGLLS